MSKMKKIFIACLLIFYGVMGYAQNEKFYEQISTPIDESKFVDSTTAKNVYTFFKTSGLFKWHDYNNCEDRANAISILLDAWQMPNYKAWVFSGQFLTKDNGLLTNRYGVRWKYHVAVCLPVKVDGQLKFITIDPSTTEDAVDVAFWANNVTDKKNSYYFLTPSNKYIWGGKGKNISQHSFFDRNKTNYEYTIQGLAGFNGLNKKDRIKMKTTSGRNKLMQTETSFNNMKNNKPSFN